MEVNALGFVWVASEAKQLTAQAGSPLTRGTKPDILAETRPISQDYCPRLRLRLRYQIPILRITEAFNASVTDLGLALCPHKNSFYNLKNKRLKADI
ncbi:MAG: hypothetical protein C1943_12920 [Halochromatium sp.]|nr:hypothetical protein [Halochromatium sp.]